MDFTKLLGIYIDEHLCWAHRMDCLSKKTARNVGILSKLKHYLPMYIMNTLYYSLILSHLQYCTLLWAKTYSTCLNKLRRILQKKAIRIITQSHYLAHTDPLFSKLKLLKLDDLYKHQLGIYMYKSTKGLLPDSNGNTNTLYAMYMTIISETKMGIISSTLELTAEHLQYITLDQYSGIHYPNS